MSFPSLQSHLRILQRVSSGDTQAPEKMQHPSLWFVSMNGDLRGPVLCLIDQSCPTLCNPMDSSPPDSSVHGNSPGKNTGVGCHALLQEGGLKQNFWNWSSAAKSKMRACVLVTSVTSNSLRLYGLVPASLLCPWDSPGKNTGVGSHFLLQGIFPTQGSNPSILCLLHWQVCS